MIKSLKLFVSCVESMRTAEKEYEKNPIPFNKKVMEDLRNKCDAWIKWVHEREDAELAKKVPPFIGKTASSGYQGVLSSDIMEKLKETHTPDEIDKFINLMKSDN